MLTDGPETDARAEGSGPARRVAIAGGSVPLAALVGVLVVVAAGLWWLWPTFTGADDDIDVLVVADGELAEARRSVELRVREAGLSIAWREAPGLCDDVDAFSALADELDPGRVVVALGDGPACPEAAATAMHGADQLVVVAAGEGSDPAALVTAGFDVVDPTRLIGSPGGSVVLPCEWWEQPCPPGGMVVREADGSLSEAGAERLARVLVAEL